MTRISSQATYLYKRVIPAIWYGAVLSSYALLSAIAVARRDWEFFLREAPRFAMLFGVFYAMWRTIALDLADAAWIDDDSLGLRNGRCECRVPFRRILHAEYSRFMIPPRITLSLREPCELGKIVTFAVPATWPPFRVSPTVLDFLRRIDEAQRQPPSSARRCL